MFGAALYVVVGLAWVVGFNASLGATVMTVLAELVRRPESLYLVLTWPVQATQVLGWFGFDFA